jgi:hypothetical protein
MARQKKMQFGLLGIWAVLALTMTVTASPSTFTYDPVVCPDPTPEIPDTPALWEAFRVDVTTDKAVYTNAETARLTVKLLNSSPLPVYVGIGPDEPTFKPQDPNDLEPARPIEVGYVELTRLEQGPVICTATVLPDGTVVKSCLHLRSYTLPLFRSNLVSAHGTQIISTIEIPLDTDPIVSGLNPDMEGEEDALRFPLSNGAYLLDCHIHGVFGTGEIRAQQIIDVRS